MKRWILNWEIIKIKCFDSLEAHNICTIQAWAMPTCLGLFNLGFIKANKPYIFLNDCWYRKALSSSLFSSSKLINTDLGTKTNNHWITLCKKKTTHETVYFAIIGYCPRHPNIAWNYKTLTRLRESIDMLSLGHYLVIKHLIQDKRLN